MNLIILKLIFLLKILDFKKNALLRENCYEDGKYYNSFIISLLKRDYV